MTGHRAPDFNSVRVLNESDINVAFQPIVDLASRRTLAHEALTRCKHAQFSSPAVLFSRAEQEEACGRLGRVVRNVVFQQCEGHPVFINLHPQEIGQRWLVQPTDPLFLHDSDVYLEVTEAAAFEYFDLCMSVLGEVKARCNAHVVVDDFGAGHSNLERVLALKPDIVKLDMSLVRDIEQDQEKQSYAEHVIHTCRSLGARVVAEGIETMAELDTLMHLGADYGQGYLLGRPAPAPLRAAQWPVATSSVA
jgi:EAL domain-containing protein (putative c-di-GMP-specific phosphodiesterase class I)